MAGVGQVAGAESAGLVHGAGRPRGGRCVEYFPGMPEGFPTEGDFLVMRALVRMAGMLHGWTERSSRRPGHALRLARHGRRIEREMAVGP